jgi:3-hydroxyisobutyrate dehydrogenase-like beta-hydroxyacid dehydrogenase
MSERLGFVGVGAMGSRMTRNLLDAGYEVTVFDLDDEAVAAMVGAGGAAGDSPRDVAERADVVLSSLPTADAIEAAYLGEDGVVAGVSPGQLLIEMSTTKPSTTEAVAAAAEEAGATLIDAPVIGTPPVAEEATLTLMVGGPDEAFERAEPVLSTLGETLWHVGGVGDGHRAKLVNNTVMHGNYVIAAEALALADNVGLDQEQMFEVIDSGMGGSEIVRAKLDKAFANDFDPSDGSPIHNARKDVKYALDMGFESDFAMHVAAAVEENYGLAAAAGEGERDYSVMLWVLERLDE